VGSSFSAVIVKFANDDVRKQVIKNKAKYDLNNEKIIMKIEHTYRTADISNMIANNIDLDKEDIELATLIGLLHDIGRFEQMKRYNTYADKNSVDHGELGVQVLLEDSLIRKFIEETKYDDIIKTAVFNHNKYKIEEGLEGKKLLHSKIVRDADKLDDLYLGTASKCYFDKDEIISDKVFDNFLNGMCVSYTETVTKADRKVSYLAWIYDINFKFSIQYVKEKDYINQIIDNISFENEDTANKMKIIKETANEVLNRRCNE